MTQPQQPTDGRRYVCVRCNEAVPLDDVVFIVAKGIVCYKCVQKEASK